MLDLFHRLSSPDVNWWTGVLWCFYQTLILMHTEHPLTLILTAPIHCRASIDSFWRHPFTAEHPLTLILTAPIHCRASIDSLWRHPFTAEHPLTHSDGTHSLQSIHWLSFWRHPFTAEHPLLRHISPNLMKTQTHLIWDDLRKSMFLCWCDSETEVRMNTNPLVAVDCHAVRDVELSESLSFLSVHPQHLQIWHTNTHLCMKNPDLVLQSILYLSK